MGTFLTILFFYAGFLWCLSKGKFFGFQWGVFCLLSIPQGVYLELADPLPNLTLHRMIILTLAGLLLFRKGRVVFQRVPLMGILVLMVLLTGVSLVLGSQVSEALKNYFSFLLETILFYLVVFHYLETLEQAKRLLLPVALAVIFVAFGAILEKYGGVSITEILVSDYLKPEEYSRDILSTLPHRIHLGTFMAMAFPLFLPWIAKGYKIGIAGSLMGGALLLMVLAGNFFSQSRGPWLGLVIGTLVVLAISKDRSVLLVLLLIGLLGTVFLLVRPGVMKSLESSYHETLRPDSLKGGTFLYRWELWRIAHAQVSHDFSRLLFGFGPGSTSLNAIEWNLSYRGILWDIDSWDNHYAYYLYQRGYLGLIAVLLLYLLILKRMFLDNLKNTGKERIFSSGVMGGALVFMFMQTNVLMFSAQLNFFFWILVGMAMKMGTLRAEGGGVSGSDPLSRVLKKHPARATREGRPNPSLEKGEGFVRVAKGRPEQTVAEKARKGLFQQPVRKGRVG